MKSDKQVILAEIFDDFRNSPFFDFESYGVDYSDVALDFLKFLIVSTLVNTDKIEIGTFMENKKVGALISYDIYNTDKKLNLKLSENSAFTIELSYYDENFKDGDFRIYAYELKMEELEILPEGLVNLMKEVQREDTPKTYQVNTLK